MRNDPRFTHFGKFLNHTGFDELPQLFNILFGTMALIGPRPLPVQEANKLKSWHHDREKILPGVISPWILEGYHQTTFDAWMKGDIEYTKRKSFAVDTRLFISFVKYWISLIAREVARTL
jgi:lipopolysaccharide/colanic/teichoic acid biosynthesis glycosyltransferase